MLAVVGHLKVAFCYLLFVAFVCHAAELVDFRDSRSYRMAPSESLNWFEDNLSFKPTAAFTDNRGASYYKNEAWERSCPEGSRVPDAIDWDKFIRDRFRVPRKVPNMKAFVGRSVGYYDIAMDEMKNGTGEVAYYAVSGVGNQAMMLDAKRGDAKLVRIGDNDAVLVRCVSERDLYAEKGVDKKEMLLTDSRDNKKYKVEVKAGKLWMRSNLAFDLVSTAHCYMEEAKYCHKFGRFYTHSEALKVCPQGWRLPDDKDWREFQKDRALLDWDNVGQGGCRDWDQYCDQATTGHYWSATSITKNTGRSWEFRRAVRSINRTDESDQKGLYVRCVTELGESSLR